MRLLAALLATLFLSSAVVFAVVGLDAQERAKDAHVALLARLDAVQEARSAIPPVSYTAAQALTAERTRLAELGNQRLAMLTDERYAPPVQELSAVLDALDAQGLQPGDPLRSQVEAWAASDGSSAASLSRLLSFVHRSGIQEVEDLDRRMEDSLRIPDLQTGSWELVVVSEMHHVLDLLEQLVPGRGDPVLSVTGASLRRIDRSLWSTTPGSLDTPPVRLWLRLESHTHQGARDVEGNP